MPTTLLYGYLNQNHHRNTKLYTHLLNLRYSLFICGDKDENNKLRTTKKIKNITVFYIVIETKKSMYIPKLLVYIDFFIIKFSLAAVTLLFHM